MPYIEHALDRFVRLAQAAKAARCRMADDTLTIGQLRNTGGQIRQAQWGEARSNDAFGNAERVRLLFVEANLDKRELMIFGIEHGLDDAMSRPSTVLVGDPDRCCSNEREVDRRTSRAHDRTNQASI